MTRITRRELMVRTGAAAVGAGMVATGQAGKSNPASPSPQGRRVLRFAHLTDIHVQPERGAEAGMAAALRHAQSQPDPPAFILQGGDAIMDGLGASLERLRKQWACWQKVYAAECRLPVEHVLGNHDIYGWDRKESNASGTEAEYGKKHALEQLGLERSYRSFDCAGWHFIVLDSVHHDPAGVYMARLDEEQFEWLTADLVATDPSVPVIICSHIPVVAACAYFDGENEKTGNWVVPGRWIHIDARRIKDLFVRHQNVKLAVSGHIHLADRVDYAGVTYLCNGAVSGNWWKGAYDQTPAGYALIDLHERGGFAHQYVDLGWKPVACRGSGAAGSVAGFA